VSFQDLMNGGVIVAVLGLAFRTEARITRLETLIEAVSGRRKAAAPPTPAPSASDFASLNK
jgi:hypothetical protein